MSTRAESSPRRRRRTPEAAQREIIEAAEGLLRERPFRELTVDEVMRRTELSRPSFYVYFRDRHELVLRVVQHLFTEMVVPANAWLEGGGRDELAEAFTGISAVYAEYGHVLRALADAAADDPEVEGAYAQLIEGFIGLTRAKIEDEITAGRAPEMDALQIATALVWMGERYLYLSFGPDSQVSQDEIATTLCIVWRRTIYATD
jgi:AcrR family transcriptional regulator